MIYQIPGLDSREVISRYFVRDEDILVRYQNGTSEIVSKSERDNLEEKMLYQAETFAKSKHKKTLKYYYEILLLATVGLYYMFLFKSALTCIFNMESMDSIDMLFVMTMWVVGNAATTNLYSGNGNHGIKESKAELDMVKKYQLFLKHRDKIEKYIKENNLDIDISINNLDRMSKEEIIKLIHTTK